MGFWQRERKELGEIIILSFAELLMILAVIIIGFKFLDEGALPFWYGLIALIGAVAIKTSIEMSRR